MRLPRLLPSALLSSALGLGLLAGLAGPASAHTFGAYGAGFPQGFAHPLSGWDHILAMLAVGFWASQLGGRATWATPLAFVLALVGGAALGMVGIQLPLVESGIAASIVVTGLLVATAARLPLGTGMALIALFGIFHGHAHGAEMPEAAHPALYGLGFVAATVLLHLAGVMAGLGARRIDRPALMRLAGGAVATAGVAGFVLAG